MEVDMLEKIYDEVKEVGKKVDTAILNQSKVNNQFFECRGRGKNTNKIVFLILSLLLAGQGVIGYLAYGAERDSTTYLPRKIERKIEVEIDKSETEKSVPRNGQDAAIIKTT